MDFLSSILSILLMDHGGLLGTYLLVAIEFKIRL